MNAEDTAAVANIYSLIAPLVPAPALKLYRCCEDWEYNGYDDSDWFCVAYSPETDRLVRVEVGTTRFACGTNHGGGVLPMVDEYRDAAKEALVKLAVERLTHSERRRVEEPTIATLLPGTKVRFCESHRCMAKVAVKNEESCKKCGGSGQWVNPYKAKDVRVCLGCNGTKVRMVTTRAKAKDDAGKPVWEDIDGGATGVVMNQATFGRFYRNGYNSPGRSNTTVYVKLDDGREVQVPAAKLRLDKEMPSARAIRAMAEDLCESSHAYYNFFATSSLSMVG